MALKLSEVAKARRRLAIEHKSQTKDQNKERTAQNTNRSPVFVSSRSVSVA